MTRIGIAAALVVIAVLAASVQAADKQTVTPEMFGTLPAVSDAEISPDGKTLAMLQNSDDATVVVFRDLDDAASPPRGTRIERALARELYWGNDNTLLVLVSQFGKKQTEKKRVHAMEARRWLAISRETLKSQVLFGNETGYYVLSPGVPLSTRTANAGHAVFSRWTSGNAPSVKSATGSRMSGKSGGGESLFSVRLDDGSTSIIAGGTPDTDYWIVDGAGQPVVRVDSTAGSSGAPAEIRLHVRKGDANALGLAHTITGQDGEMSTLRLRGLSATTGRMLATIVREDKLTLVEYDLDSGQIGQEVLRDPAHDLDGIVYDPRIAAIRGIRFTDDMPRRIYFDPAEQRLQDSLAAALPGAAPIIWSRSADGNRYVVKVLYTDHPAQWFVFDKASKHLAMMGATHQALDGKAFARKEKYDYTASDGLPIPGYLTVPQGAPRSNMPLIVLPHGGPWARDDQSFDYWSFFYAAHGYLVYQPNFRGSDGYGARFRHAGDGEWGRKMQDDISEGVRKLVADGLVDPKRICIVGASYGGYAALAGATLTPDLYACAVSVNGISNLGDLIGATEAGARTYWEARIGPLANRPALHEVSPLHQAHKAKAPILLIHARDDTVVPVGQSRAIAKALAAAGKKHEFVELKGEDHWLSRGETRTEMLARSIAFIDRHIGARAE